METIKGWMNSVMLIYMLIAKQKWINILKYWIHKSKKGLLCPSFFLEWVNVFSSLFILLNIFIKLVSMGLFLRLETYGALWPILAIECHKNKRIKWFGFYHWFYQWLGIYQILHFSLFILQQNFLNALSKLTVSNFFPSFSPELTQQGSYPYLSAKRELFNITKDLYSVTFNNQFSGFTLPYILEVADYFLLLELYSPLVSTTCFLIGLPRPHHSLLVILFC